MSGKAATPAPVELSAPLVCPDTGEARGRRFAQSYLPEMKSRI